MNAPSDGLPAERIEELRADPEARLEFLLERDVLVEHADGTIEPTGEFEDDRLVYVDSYQDASDEEFRSTVAELFGLDEETAAERIDGLGLERWDLATFLAVREALEPDLPRDVVLELATMVAETGYASPVPTGLQELRDDDHAAFLEREADAVVVVFQLGCDPCDALKADLDEIRDLAPDGVSFAGVDGEECPEFRREFEVSVAPTVLLFAGGECVETMEGYQSPDTLDETFDEVYPDR